ncbi:unnamed protein product [Peronospora belbahrii]|uniref:PDZ domain-containing protein n=1 Tax=Peronospora belbahrii TaxID=622444 RepID=A0ABN8CKT7_9STRA|nr:unnamed protein product [Peronospora belbahrii]
MNVQVGSYHFGNRHSTSNATKTLKTWFPKTPIAAPLITHGKEKKQAPQRLESIESSAETITSQDDYGDDIEQEKIGVNRDGKNTDKDVKRNKFHENATSSLMKHDTNKHESSRIKEYYQYEIILWFGCSLDGVEFAFCDAASGYPYVEATNGNESLPGMWNIREGDFLVAVNECTTHNSAMSYESVMQIVSTCARPAVLLFRRPSMDELQQIPILKKRPTNEERLGRRRNRERLEKSLAYVIWRESDGPLGVSLKKQRGSLYPAVADMNRSSIIRRYANIGDPLISINQHDVYKLGNTQWMQLLKSAPKPLVLTFRRLCSPRNQKRERMLDL